MGLGKPNQAREYVVPGEGVQLISQKGVPPIRALPILPYSLFFGVWDGMGCSAAGFDSLGYRTVDDEWRNCESHFTQRPVLVTEENAHLTTEPLYIFSYCISLFISNIYRWKDDMQRMLGSSRDPRWTRKP